MGGCANCHPALLGSPSMSYSSTVPFEMGHRAPAVLIDLIGGKKVPDPLYTGLDECTAQNMGKCPAQ